MIDQCLRNKLSYIRAAGAKHNSPKVNVVVVDGEPTLAKVNVHFADALHSAAGGLRSNIELGGGVCGLYALSDER